ncbi:uncharacterized protein BHQ10_005401 [Talaromyces amestolkiae]|uniref:Phenylalanine ammonia-lyase n=1 Tax=Talaromyces amestolkiae TaxID=1196081 RepID=A0A364L0P7_TALAM|nr:uncharacterized protein BHQ10_005401 [Talaromyces amestolkiae]RAO69389.1 hypothetical protein BHQ10_005401 [Talaromyces amestolkiae]
MGRPSIWLYYYIGALKAFGDTHAGCEFRWLLGHLAVFWPQPTFMKNVRITHQFIQHYVDAALQRGGSPSFRASSVPSIPRVLFIDQLTQRSQDRKIIQDELTTLYFAGTDAPAALLSNLFFVLSKKPAVWDRLRTEVRPLEGKAPSIDQLKKLRYGRSADAYLVLRLYPPQASNSRIAVQDTILPKGGGPGGESPVFVRKGTMVHFSIYALHRDKGLWGHDAEEFRPERWDYERQSWVRSLLSVTQSILTRVNTGFGGSADTRPSDIMALQRTLTRELSYGILSPASRDPLLPSHVTAGPFSRFELAWEDPAESYHLPLTWVRAAILLRMNSLIKGHSGIRPVIFERLHALLTHNIIPMVPIRGSISASGDLSPLAYISGAIQGKGTIRVLSPDQKQDLYADEALAKAGLPPVSLTAKEGLAIVNGTAISTAAASLVLHDMHQLALLSQILTAMSVEALLGSPESFDELFGQVRPHPGQIESARNINAFLRGSKLAGIKDGKDGTLRQDRYSIRTAAQWIGPVLEDLLLAHQQITIECNSVTDNPLIDNDGKVVHGGNFQAKAVTSAMEKCRQGIQSIGRMIFTQCRELINPATSWGLPPNLVAEDPSKSGIFKAIDIYISALTSELGFLAAPVNHVYTAEMGNQSLNSLALISARYTATAAKILTELAAAHILSACQALDLRAMHLLFLDSVQARFNMLVSTLEANLNLQPKESPLLTILWAHVERSLEQTVAIDTEERFVQVAKSLRVPIIDYLTSPLESSALEEMESLIMKLTVLLQEGWVSNRDVYLDHGDASTILGTASRQDRDACL